jgi:hypothetical protein
MALHAVDPSEGMLAEWDRWSQAARDQYEDGACAAKWETFTPDGGLGLGTLIHWAREDGWVPPTPPANGRAQGDTSEPVHLTDRGNAVRLARQHGHDLRHCHPWGKWLVWDGRRWRVDDTAAVTRRANSVVVDLFRQAQRRVDDVGKRLERGEQP